MEENKALIGNWIDGLSFLTSSMGEKFCFLVSKSILFITLTKNVVNILSPWI